MRESNPGHTKTCRNCDKILHELENIDDDADKFGVAFAKTTDKKAAKKLGVTSFPALVYFRNKQPAIFEGDLMDEEKVLAWLTDLDSMELPDKIEEVNAKILENLIEDTDYVVVLFYKEDCERCDLVLHELEEIDDEADGQGIAFVKIADVALATEYGLEELPTLVYYRRKIPIVYSGDLMNEEDVLKWIFEFKDLGEDPDSIEDVSSKALDSLISKSPFLAVLFYDADDKYNQKVLKELENIDDDTDKHDIPFVKISDLKEAAEYGIEKLPALVYFEKKIANFYQGDLMKEEELLTWLIKQKNTDEIEHVTEKFLEQLIRANDHVAVLFYDPKGRQGKKVLTELENIDDEMDQHGILFVKIDDDDMAKAYGIRTLPQLVYFENEAPIFYDGDLTNEEVVLQWMIEQKKSDEIEDVSDVVMVQMIKRSEFLAVLFYDADEEETKQVLTDLEKIDDDTDVHNIPFVKIDNDKVAAEFGIDDLPALVYFENQIPYIYSGNLTDEEEVLNWLIHQKEGDEIEDITDKILEKLIRKSDHLAVLFYDNDDPKSMEVLAELENIDDETDSRDLPFVRIDDDEVARAFGIDDELPTLVYFEQQIPFVYQGDLKNEVEVLTWLLDQMTSDEIEEVTDKMVDALIKDHPHLVVLFYDSKVKKSEKVLKELENIDDEADKRGIIFVKTDDKEAAEKYKISKLPGLVYFQEGKPDAYTGDLMKEEEVLLWLLEHKASDDDIEEITEPTLQKLIDNSDHLAVLFYDKDSPVSETILTELENIDDELDGYEIPFVKIDDDRVAKKYGIMDELPILVYFEDKLPSVYEGDLTKEEAVLKWLIHQKDDDTIEEVTEEILENIIKNNHYVLVFYGKGIPIHFTLLFNKLWFSAAPNTCEECPAILKELESIDDDTDSHGIMFLTTDDLHLAKSKYQVSVFPSLVLFRHGKPVQYKGEWRQVRSVLVYVCLCLSSRYLETRRCRQVA
ncbi:hypothetical protein LAZ67_17002343 [Cordylochernes scorpioides]|uniref:Thioredoxin domain-containing protein n=1 Tax=Cordylochernes scorpioides TaxID=51811 RepID=A0ABY6LFB0_9ARAC|nr:hypothetical protein LAZ67_17002343 [Cordylochernes scorpioides]